MREQTQVLATLNTIGTALAGQLDLERLIQMITDAGVELTGAQFGAYFHNEMDESGERAAPVHRCRAPRARTSSGSDGRARPRCSAPTFRNEGAIRSDDILADPRYGQLEPFHGMPEGHLPVRSYLAVPVVARSGRVLGGLLFGPPRDRPLQRDA